MPRYAYTLGAGIPHTQTNKLSRVQSSSPSALVAPEAQVSLPHAVVATPAKAVTESDDSGYVTHPHYHTAVQVASIPVVANYQPTPIGHQVVVPYSQVQVV